MTVETRLVNTALHAQKLARTKQRRKTLGAARKLEHAASSIGRNDLSPTLAISELPPTSLAASANRTRKTDPDHLARIVSSIKSLGFSVPVIRSGNEIIDGHVRVEAAIALGLERIATIDCGHLSPTEVRTLRLAVNRLGELGTYDPDRLRCEFQELIELEVDIEFTGFTLEDQDIILLDPDPVSPETAEIEPPEVPVSRLGDIWALDDHRIMCGNALAPETYDAVLQGDCVEAIIADFPYNVKIAGNVSGLGKKKHGEFVMASGEMSVDQFTAFLTDATKAASAHLVDGGVFFGFMDWRSIDLLYAAGRSAGLTLLNLVVWYKGGGMGAFYRSAHELIAVFCNGESSRVNNVKLGKNGRDRTNVWEVAGANRPGSSAASMLHAHASPKPLELCVDAILDVTNRGETVLDPFLGSGTTLIAADKAGRRCFGIELDPKFVDVSVRRWEEATGEGATLLETGETFAETAAARKTLGM